MPRSAEEIETFRKALALSYKVSPNNIIVKTNKTNIDFYIRHTPAEQPRLIFSLTASQITEPNPITAE